MSLEISYRGVTLSYQFSLRTKLYYGETEVVFQDLIEHHVFSCVHLDDLKSAFVQMVNQYHQKLIFEGTKNERQIRTA